MIMHATRRQVKGYRNTPRPAGRFGAGLLRSAPSYRLDCTIADLAEVAALFAADYDADEIDETRAAEWEAMERLERGFCL